MCVVFDLVLWDRHNSNLWILVNNKVVFDLVLWDRHNTLVEKSWDALLISNFLFSFL
jgi:hypothetical protein